LSIFTCCMFSIWSLEMIKFFYEYRYSSVVSYHSFSPSIIYWNFVKLSSWNKWKMYK
jgi:hypothetical protein